VGRRSEMKDSSAKHRIWNEPIGMPKLVGKPDKGSILSKEEIDNLFKGKKTSSTKKSVRFSGRVITKAGFTGKKRVTARGKKPYDMCYRNGVHVPCNHLTPGEAETEVSDEGGGGLSAKDVLTGIKEMFDDLGKVKPEDVISFKGVLEDLNSTELDKLKEILGVDDREKDDELINKVSDLASGERGKKGEEDTAPDTYEDWIRQLPSTEQDSDEIENPTAEGVSDYLSKMLEGEVSAYHVKEVARLLSRMDESEIDKLRESVGEVNPDTQELVESVTDIAKETTDGEAEGVGGGGRGEDVGAPEETGGQVEGETEGPTIEATDREREDASESASEAIARRIPATVEEANKRLDKYIKLFQSRYTDEGYKSARFMELLRDHINEVGTDAALKELGEEIVGEGDRGGVEYAGWELEGTADTRFVEKYLDRNGISLLSNASVVDDVGEASFGRRIISTVAPSSDEEGVRARGDERDVFPSLQTLRDKLDEAQHLPGLEKSEDIGKLMGQDFGSKVSHFTPNVVKKLDETYGEGGWIVKSYGDEAYAGYGIFFPQRVAQLNLEAKNVIWDSGAELAKYGFMHLRDENGKIVGIKHSGGEDYLFGTDKYNDTITGEAKRWSNAVFNDRLVKEPDGKIVNVGSPADNEMATNLPTGRFMAQPAFPVVGITNEERAQGITFKRGGEGRVHITTRNGKAEIIPHSTWLKLEPLPVVFESEDTRAMAQAAVDAINFLPESERQGQLYAPDIVRTADGYKVVEANPANEAGASGYLQDNPFVIDAYVSHLTGREPGHVKFIRNLLTKRGRHGRRRGEDTARTTVGSGTESGSIRGETVSANDAGRTPGGYQPPKESPEETEKYNEAAEVINKKRNAESTVANANLNVRKYGFYIAYDDNDKPIGIEHENGDLYEFDTDRYNDTIGGDVRHWADKVADVRDDLSAKAPEGLKGDNRFLASNQHSPKEGLALLKEFGVDELEASGKGNRGDHPQDIKDKHNEEILSAAKEGGFFIPPERLPFLAKGTENVGGYEHDVYQDKDNNTYYKLTTNGKFGHGSKDIYEYVQRHDIANKLWPALGYKFRGVTEDHENRPQAIMSMNRIAGGLPEQDEINKWFRDKGWKPVGWDGEHIDDNIRSWRDPVSGTTISDTHTGNFIKNEAGLVPIDVDILPGKKLPKGEKRLVFSVTKVKINKPTNRLER
jgi:hypothetical protein